MLSSQDLREDYVVARGRSIRWGFCWLRGRGKILIAPAGAGMSRAGAVPSSRILVVGALSVLVLAFGTPVARGSFEKVDQFGASGEGRLETSQMGIAVNDASRDVYVAAGSENRVTRYDSKGSFLEAWGWGVADGANEFQTCGPDGEAHGSEAHRACKQTQGISGEGSFEFGDPKGIAVDQATGNVYVLNLARKSGVVQVFSVDGKKLIGEFGQQGIVFGEPVGDNPARIHSPHIGGIAVDDSGNVYVVDDAYQHRFEARVMVFKPEVPGNYEHYMYSPPDTAVGLFPVGVALDSTGDLYINKTEQGVGKFAAGNLTTQVCEKTESLTGVGGMTVDRTGIPATENLFFYGNKGRKFHMLDPSCEQKSVGGEFKGAAEEEETTGLAFDPGLVWEAGRPSGVLYAVDSKLHGLIFARASVTAPRVDSESVSGVGETSARLEALIDPRGSDTTFRFQYGVEEDCKTATPPNECKEVPLGGADLGSGQKDITAAVTVSGLSPGTPYHFRVLASSHCNEEEPEVVCLAEGSDSVFSTFGTIPSPPDGRVFELVSPPVKNGGEVFPENPAAGNCQECLPGINDEHFPMQSAPDGNSVVYEGLPFSPSGVPVNENEYLSTRVGSGWGTRDLSSPLEKKETVRKEGYKAVSSDLAHAVLYEIKPSLTPEAPEGYPDLYLQDTATTGPAGLRPLLTSAPPDRGQADSGANEFKMGFAGASADFRHLIFQANDALEIETGLSAQDGGAGKNNLYEWVNGQLRLVNVLPGNTETHAGAVFGSGIELQTTAEDPDYSHAISNDGSRIFWTDEGNGHVYVRENAETTIEIPDSKGVQFLTASADGTRVLLNDGHLYDLAGETFVLGADLTAGEHGFQGILGASEDLASVYFIDTAVLNGEENSEHEKAVAGKYNLYLHRESSTVYIATLSPNDNGTEANAGGSRLESDTSDWAASPSDRTAQVTPDGEYLAFMSRASLTGNHSQPAEPQDCSLGTCFEVFEYNAATKHLACPSCNPTGERPVGLSALSLIFPRSGFLEQPHNLLANGRLFFDSLDTLSPHDTNGNAEDVYEYEPQGLGTCAQPNGCVSLISSGDENTNSSFLNATPTGNDVFFTTRSQLVPQDQDDLIDLYDARVNGNPPPSEESPPCATNETCKTTFPPSPLFQAPPSNTLTGAGNLTQPLPQPPTPPKPPTQKQLLEKALKACHKQKSKKKRVACETKAHRRYGPAKKAKKAKKAGRRK